MYVAAFIFRKYLSPVLFFLIYYLVFYQDSLSIVRQSFAISFSTLAFAYYMSKKYKKYIFFMALAFGFHSTVVLTLVYPLLLWFLNKYPLKENTIKYGLFLIVGIAVVVNLDFLLLLLINLGAINAKYLIYTSESEVFKGGLGVTNFIVKFVIIFFVYSYRKVHKKTLFIDFAYVLSIMDMMLCLFALLMEPLDRFALYPRLMSCITLPILFKACSKKNTFLQIQKYGLILFLIAYWCYVYMWGDYGSTANYKFVLM